MLHFVSRLRRTFSVVLIAFAFVVQMRAQTTSSAAKATKIEVASLHPATELRWQRTSPAKSSLEGPVLYALIIRSSATPNSIPKVANNFTLTDSLIKDNGSFVAIGNLSIAADGTITFKPGQAFPGTGSGTISGITTNAGSGLQGGVTSGNANLSLLTSCASGQILKWSGTAWACAADNNTTYAAGSGLALSANTFSIDTNVVPTLAGTNTWAGTNNFNGGLNVGGAWNVSSSGGFTNPASTVTFNGTVNGTGNWTDTSGTMNFGNVTIGSGAVTLNSSGIAAENLSIHSGATTLDLNGTSTTSLTTPLLTVSGSASFPNVAGTVTFAGNVNGTGNWTNTSGAVTYNNLIVDSGTTTVNSTGVTTKALTVTSGNTLNLNGHTITLNGSYAIGIDNSSTTPTVLYQLAELDTSTSPVKVKNAGTDPNVPVTGIVVANAGNSGRAYVAVGGSALCVFGGSTTAGNFVSKDINLDGDCLDVGSNPPAGTQIIGRALTTNSGGGTYLILLGGSAQKSGTVTSVSAVSPLSSSGGTTPTISLAGVVPVNKGGTGSSTQNFVDLSSDQTINGNKTHNGTIIHNGHVFLLGGVSGDGSGLTNLDAATLGGKSASAFMDLSSDQTANGNKTYNGTSLFNGKVLLVGGSVHPALGTATSPTNQFNSSALQQTASGWDPSGGGSEHKLNVFLDLEPISGAPLQGSLKLQFSQDGIPPAWTGFSVDTNGVVTGNGSGLTNLNAGNVTTGVVPIINLPVASTSAKGVVQLGSSSDTTAGLVVQTNDSRLSDSRAASSVNFGIATLTGVVPNINLPNLVTSLNGLNNNVVLVPGSNITIAPSGQNLTIAAASTFVNTIVVHRVGTPAQNGQALLDALAGITTASANNPFLLKIEPGTYDLGTQSLNMKQFVDIEGSGQLSTTITASGRAVAFSGTISGTDNAEIRSLTVTNTGGNSFAAGIVNFGASPQITDVRVIVSGGTDSQFGNLGIHNVFGGQATITDVKVSVFSNSGSAGCVGILNAGTSPTMNNVSVNMSSGLTGSATGVYNSSNAQPVINNLTVNISGGTGAFNAGILNSGTASPSVTSSSITVLGSSGSTNYGVRNLANSSPMLSGITLDVSGGNVSVDVSSDSSSPMVNNMTASAHGASNANQCIACTNNSACQVGQSRCNVTGTGTSVDCDDCNSNSTCEISHSHLSCTTVTMQECDGVANSSSNLILQNSDVMTSGNGTNKGVVNMANAGNFTIIIKNSSIMGMAAIDSTACAGCTSNVTNSELDGAVAGGTNNCGGAFTSNALPRNNICQ